MRALPVVVAALLVAGCGSPVAAPANPPAVSKSTDPSTTFGSPKSSIPATGSVPPTDPLTADFETFSATVPAKVGVAVASGATTYSFGAWDTGSAWSTIKVPLAIAALRADPANAEAFIPAAISQSDNAAAEGLWALLGDPPQAALTVQEVLAEGGDAMTVVESDRVRAGFTAFGQTNWPVAAQARFAWGLPCIAGSQTVVRDMRSLAGNQAWGLAGDDGVAAKGGWGPGPGGGYLVRQLATIETPEGVIGVALAAEPSDGSFESGVAAVVELADWIRGHREAFRPTPC